MRTTKSSNGQPMPKDALRNILQGCKFDPDLPVTKEDPVLTIDGATIGTLGNFVTFMGRPKVGKTTFISVTEASLLHPDNVWGIKLTAPPGRDEILHVDTEQSRHSFRRAMGNVSRYAGLTGFPRKITGVLLRDKDDSLFMPLIELAIEENPKAAVVVIDGFLDLLPDFNNIEDSKRVVDWLKRITQQYNILIIGVVHQSKRDAYSIGHLGSMVERYGQALLTIEKDATGKVHTLTGTQVRDDKAFEPITVHEIDGVLCRDVIDIKSVKEKPEHLRLPGAFSDTQHNFAMGSVMTEKGMIYATLRDTLAEFKGMSKANAQRHLAYWLQKGWIYKGVGGLYYRKIDVSTVFLNTPQK